MRMRYFEDTDTALPELGFGDPAKTRELSEDIYHDLDMSGNVDSNTLKHADRHSDLSEFSFIRSRRTNEPGLETAR